MEISYKRNDRIIRRKFYQYLVPTVLMVMAMQFGSLADAILVGNLLGSDVLTAVSLGLPIVFFVEVPGFTIAVGASIVGANMIGKRQTAMAGQVFKLSLLLSFLVGLIFIPIGIFFGDSIASLLAGNFTGLTPFIVQYIKVYFYQAPLLGLGLVVAYFLPSDNSPNLGAAFFVISNIAHLGALVLFALFLPFDVAVYGAASSMGIGMVAGLVVLIVYAKSKKRTIDLKAPIKGSWQHFLPTVKAGSVTAVFTLLSGVFYLILNIAATSFLTDAEMPIYAMLSNFAFVIDLFIIGVLQLLPSVIPALFGEKDIYGVKTVLRRAVFIALGIAIALTGLSLAWPELFFMIFGVSLADIRAGYDGDPLLIVRVYVIAFVFYTANRALANYYSSILVNSPGIVNNILRIGAIGPALIYVLMMHLGAMGYAIGNAVMEAAALGLTILFVFIGNKIHKLPGKGLLLLPGEKEVGECIDVSIPAQEKEISLAVEQIQTAAMEMSHNETASAMLAIACEEIVANTIQYGYKRHHKAESIDISLSRSEDSLLLRIRDDGIAFDPTVYSTEEKEEFRFNGIEVVRNVADDFKYLRVLNTNNTIISVLLSRRAEEKPAA